MGHDDTVGEQLVDLRLRPTVYDEFRDDVEISSRVHLVSNTRCDDCEDGGGTLTADVEPSK